MIDFEKELVKKMGFPMPESPFEERLKIRLARRNERKLYKDVCDLTGKPMISLYSPDKPYKVYSQEAWWGDNWDARDYGRDYDFERPFFEQFHELSLDVPRLSLMNMKAENSEYCNMTSNNRNCYLVFGGDYNEDCMYSTFNMHSRNCLDLYWADNCELCYELVDCNKCYGCKYMQNCYNCRDCNFMFECRGCSDCLFCVGLNNQKYHIFNKAYSREEYEQKLKEYDLGSYEKVRNFIREFEKFVLEFPHKYAHILNAEDVSGDYIVDSKNCENCFDVTGPAQDLKDVFLAGWNLKDAFSCDHVGHGTELIYEISTCVESYNCAFCVSPWACREVFYCEQTVNGSKHLFGCSHMKKTEYCILNKQYKEAEYFEMKDRIIAHMKSTGEWGKFFPMKYSPFAYNETVAQDIFPMSKDEVLAAGLKWLDEEVRDIPESNNLPDNIKDAFDDVLKLNLVCEKSGRPYKINEKELGFYKRINIPLPRFAPETRNEIRSAKRNPMSLWKRKCNKCGAKIHTSYSPERLEIVYCEKCYLENTYA